MGMPARGGARPARLHARAFPVVDPLQHGGGLGRGPERGAGSGYYGKIEDMVARARVRDRDGRGRAPPATDERPEPDTAGRRERGDARHRDVGDAPPPPRPTARAFAAWSLVERARLGSDARDLPGGAAARRSRAFTIRSTRCSRAGGGAERPRVGSRRSRARARQGRSARTRRRGAAARPSPAGALNELIELRGDARPRGRDARRHLRRDRRGASREI